jgi:hypothetical protein
MLGWGFAVVAIILMIYNFGLFVCFILALKKASKYMVFKQTQNNFFQ